jgi:hypothetical protein
MLFQAIQAERYVHCYSALCAVAHLSVLRCGIYCEVGVRQYLLMAWFHNGR